MKKAIKVNNQTIIGVPKQWVRPSSPEFTTLGYHTLPDAEHFADGWKEVVTPVYNSSIEKLGELVEHTDRFEYEVEPLTDEVIQNRIISNSEATKEQRIKEISDAKILEETFNETDIQTVLDNMDLYPMWEADMEVSTSNINGIPERYKDFNNDNELVLWEVIQDHTTQSDWRPKDVPALFKRVELDGVIPVFVQPTGGHDAYQIGDQVHFPTETDPVYESLINGNVWSPTGYPAGWQMIP